MFPPDPPNQGEPIKASWARELIEWIRNDVMPKGDGGTTKCSGNIVTAIQKKQQEEYDGPLSVYYDSKKAKLIIRHGWLIRNGEWIDIPETELNPAAGYVVISSTLEESGWSTVEVKIGTPSATAYPIAYIEYENSKMKLKSYRTAVAVIMAVKTCPIAKMNQA